MGLGVLPQVVAQKVISRFQTISGLSPKVLSNFSLNSLVDQRINDYAHNKGPYKCITMGAALGGATTYLSLALGSPFLPQAFVITIKGGAPDGDVNIYFNRSANAALEIARNNPELITIQHFDPIHDGWLTKYVNHLRFKLLKIPPAYVDYIRNNLVPGGTILFLDGQAKWLRYKVGSQSYFQVGGWGDISAQEYLEGSERIQNYAKKTGLKKLNWKLVGYPLETGPESEWGSELGLAIALKEFCSAEGYQFIQISLPHPNDFSKLAFNTALFLLSRSHQEPSGVLIETFTQFDSQAALNSGLLPLWLIFNTVDNLFYLKDMCSRFPLNKPIFFSPLATFSITPDLVHWSDWENALEGFNWINIGTRPDHYPADARTIVNWAEPLRSWVAEHPQPIIGNIDPLELLKLSQEL
jgi:hypothetical protein